MMTSSVFVKDAVITATKHTQILLQQGCVSAADSQQHYTGILLIIWLTRSFLVCRLLI